MALSAVDVLSRAQTNPRVVPASVPWQWVEQNKILLDGRPMDFKRHPYQLALLAENFTEECDKKGAQMGFTSARMLNTIHGHIYKHYPQGTLYLFPTRGDVTDFSKGRFGPLINDNPCLQKHIQDTDAANIKRISGTMLYFRGTNSRSQLKSVPVDQIIFDEIDEMSPDMVQLALARVGHSEVKRIVKISTPTLPDYGIDREWQESTQHLWWIKCARCGGETCLEKEFEEHLFEGQEVLLQRSNGSIYRACRHCRARINPLLGTWRATYPRRRVVGRWISQLCSAYVSPAEILAAFSDTTKRREEVYNSMIGMAYVDAKNRLGIRQVLSMCSDYGIADSDDGPCVMGVDRGKDLHVVIGRPDKIIALDAVKSWEDLSDLIARYHVIICVIDAMPEVKDARAFTRKHPDTVWMNWYVENQKGPYAWDDEQFAVKVNRTESLDASAELVDPNVLTLPRLSDRTEEFARHCHATAKRLIEDEETGARVYRYLKLGADHYRHAFNYWAIARSRVLGSFFAK